MSIMTATLRMLLIFIILGQMRLVTSTIVPVDGVFIITMVADPDGRTDMFLQLDGHDAGFVAYAEEYVIAGLTVGLYLKAGTRVGARFTGDPEGATNYGMALASYIKDSFVTVRSNGYSSSQSNAVHFHHQYLSGRTWKSIPATSTFRAKHNGIYWVSARPDCGSGDVSLNVGGGLFNVFCNGDKAISASGAFYLLAGEALQLTFNSGGTLQGGTSFSFVYLEGNQRTYLNNYQHAAYTAWADRTGTIYKNETLSFDGRIATDYGWLYNPTYRTWTIGTAGSYIVSLRGDPDSSTLNVHLYKNDDMKYVFAWYNEGGTKSGQAGIFDFASGDKLFMISPNERYLGPETFMSIALLWTESGYAFI
ncbi:uncharacterized protein [Littorina saxatilis]|uniref:Uncharacterized protein n=1 Tax=Littorina saxatilis TaxID=31220 RepID=A0AAN9AK41_9CAEN